MEDKDFSKIKDVLDAIENVKSKVDTEEYNDAYLQLRDCIRNLDFISTEEAEQIVDAMVEAGIKIDSALLLNIFLGRCQLHSLNKDCVENIFNLMEDNIVFDNYVSESLSKKFLDACGENSLDADCVKMFLKRNLKKIDEEFLSDFLNVCGENSLDGENLENLYHNCSKSSFTDYSKDKIDYDLNETSKKLFQKLCEFHEKEKLSERKAKNKKLGILGGTGVTFGVLCALGAIGLGAAIGVGALAVTIVAPIVAAVVGLVLLGIFGYLIDKFRVNKVLNEIAEAKLNEQEVDEKEIPFDLRKRKEIQNALDESQKQLLQNSENEISY